MSKKMWSKIFKSSKTTKVAKLSTATATAKANKRCSIYEEYQQLNGAKVEGAKKQKKLAKGVEQQSKQPQEQEQQHQNQQQQQPNELQQQKPMTAGDVASTTDAGTHKNAETKTTTTNMNKNSEVTQMLGTSDVTLASSSTSNNSKPPAGANDQLIANKNNNNSNRGVTKQQSTFAKVVSSFSLKRNNNAGAQKQQQPQQQLTKGSGSVKAVGKVPKNNSNTIASTADPYPDAPTQLVPCPICQRTFNPVTLQKHVGICEKMATKKRNVFDSSRQRREGTELASYPLPKNFGLPPAKQETRGQSPKPLQHIASPILARKKSSGGEELARSTARASMRKLVANAQSQSPGITATTNSGTATASQVVNNSQMTTSTASLPGAGSFTRDRMRSSDRSLAKRIQPPPAEQCPHCERCFGPKAYDRHVEWCKEKALQASIKHTAKTEQNLAKERLEARTKYRAPCLKTKRSLNRDKYAGLAGDENEFGDTVKAANGSHNSNSNNNSSNNNNSSLTNGVGGHSNSNNINNSGSGNGNGVMSLSMTSSLTSESGLPSDRYDPFLSAKRQLEELCSSSPPTNPSFSSNLPKTTPQTPVSPAGLPAKMSTSLTLSTSTPNSSPLTNNSQNQRQTATPSVNATKTTSNFRRTSSLRGPRRSPMLSSRPLFAQNHRPTIQRGLSDEGPISTNFLKPEEYDEMPVRSVCVNDYAVTKSPRVTRRDNSLSNRKQGLKLNVQGAAATMTSATNTPNCVTMLGVNSSDELMNSAAKYLSKTDSLAAFLKYEKELDKLNAQTTVDKPTEQNTNESSATNLHNNIISKEFKEKSNTLSKQNSAKSIKAELIESPKLNIDPVVEAHLFQHLPTPVPKTPNAANTSPYERTNANIQKTQAIRLESIALPQATSTPITKPSTTRAPTTPTQLPIVNRPVNLNALLSEPRPTTTSLLSAYSKEGKNSSSNEYIDPKLINKCDNLPVNLNTVRTLKSVGGNNAERRLDFSSSSSECSATQTGPISQLTKLLPLTKPTEVLHTTAAVVTTTSPAVDIPSRPSTTDDTQPNAHPTLSQRSSTEGRNLLNRKKRLGRNHFLYDVSPEADDSCSADDEANRSSVEYYESKYKSSYQQQQQEQQEQQPQTCFVNTRGQTTQLKTPPIVPPLPIFDDFDFEEFLSSFENDDEQFPLFKDCREFLLNRSSNKQRSTQTPSSINTNNNSNHNNNNSKTNQYTTPTKDYNSTTNHFQFPSLASNKYSHPTHLLTPSSRRSRDESRPKSKESSPLSDRYEDLKRVNTQSHTYANDGMTTKRHADADHKKREIFISIETEPNEHGRSPISPDSLRSMVGNPQTMVEVEVDGCDNKFSKISDDDEQLPPRHVAGQSHTGDMLMRCTPFNTGNHLPNVQLNNAKNLIQRMQDDFRQMSEEVGANIRQAMTGLNAVGGNTAMLYGNEQVGMTVGAGGRGGIAGGTYVPHNPNTTPPPSTASAGAVTPMYAASGDVSGDACGDSDDMSSLDGYPISSKSSRRGVGSKLSADSAYGSLSRQRSSELSSTPQRSATRTRPTTSSSTGMTTTTLPAMLPADVQTQKQLQQQQQYHYQQQQQQLPQQAAQLYKYAPVAARPRRISASSSSDNSDASDCNVKYKQQQQKQQQQQQQLYSGVGNKNHNNNNNYISAHYTPQQSSNSNNNNITTNNSNNNYESPLSSPTTMERAHQPSSATNTGLPQDEAQTAPAAANKGHYSSSSSLSSTNAAMSASMKMSKFCHECGAKFLVEQAKFCMDCGVKRIVL
ncbi:probable WRKY transcription factor protein 1 isoform X1 [Bactrocera dorsalis]|uniref:Probable WRKY transcription factor protein 1 isoform X1 n=1 Tax=Bactrocera dorsalis TaxID=27457 RepID=A0A6I9VBS8_BACDO|nr:probable WRKY transcription factor protein 1 isoform X1 [Bactrocera dorsalis]